MENLLTTRRRTTFVALGDPSAGLTNTERVPMLDSSRYMQLNTDKSGVIILDTSAQLRSVAAISLVDVAGCTLPVSSQVKPLGVITDSHNALWQSRQSCRQGVQLSYSLKQLTSKTPQTTACSVIRSRIDYCNSTLQFGALLLQLLTNYKRRKTTSHVSSVNSANAWMPDHCWSHYTGCRYNSASSTNSPSSRTRLCRSLFRRTSTNCCGLWSHMAGDVPRSVREMPLRAICRGGFRYIHCSACSAEQGPHKKEALTEQKNVEQQRDVFWPVGPLRDMLSEPSFTIYRDMGAVLRKLYDSDGNWLN